MAEYLPQVCLSLSFRDIHLPHIKAHKISSPDNISLIKMLSFQHGKLTPARAALCRIRILASETKKPHTVFSFLTLQAELGRHWHLGGKQLLMFIEPGGPKALIKLSQHWDSGWHPSEWSHTEVAAFGTVSAFSASVFCIHSAADPLRV